MRKGMAKNPCVLQDWLLSNCSWRQQTVLFTALRGPDGLPKSNSGKVLCRFLRSCVLRDATPNRGTFMGILQKEAVRTAKKFIDAHDEYPHHFIMHLAHSAEILGYKHPNQKIRNFWKVLYEDVCSAFHMYPETEKQMDLRLRDDIVSNIKQE